MKNPAVKKPAIERGFSIIAFLRRRVNIILAGAALLILYLISRYNYLLFHVFAEMFAIVVACVIFVVSWNTRRFLTNNYLLFIGAAYLFVGIIDLLHTMTYEGMGVFQGYSINLATQLWIAARYLESISLLAATWFLGRKINLPAILLGFCLIFTLVIVTIFFVPVFPVCYVEEQGLTTFKKISEYVISLILLISILALYYHRDQFEGKVLRYLIKAIAITISSEILFTVYKNPFSVANFLGHYLKIISFYYIYKAIIETGLKEPYNLLFRELRVSRDELEQRVQDRTTDLSQTVENLRQEIAAHQRTQQALSESRSRLTHAQRLAHIGNWQWDIVHNRIFWSEEIYRIFGFANQEFELTYEVFLSLVHPADREYVKQAVQRALEENKPYNINHRIIKKDGSVRIVHEQAEVTYDETGTPSRMLGTVQDITERRRLEKQVLEIGTYEQRRIGQDLHDSVGQLLTGVSFMCDTFKQSLAEKSPPEAAAAEEIAKYTRQALAEIRALSKGLCPVDLGSDGLMKSLKRLAGDIENLFGVSCSFQCPEPILIEDNTVATHVYHIAQEALNNSVKHGQARQIQMSLRHHQNDGAVLEVRDDGVGIPQNLDPSKGLGLHTMKYRAEMIAGMLDIYRGPQRGTVVRCAFSHKSP